MKHLLDLIEDLELRNIALVSLNEQIDTTSANGRLILRLLAGLEAARKQGRVGGRPRALSPAGAAEATRMYREDQTVTHIAAALRVSRATIYRHIAALNSPGR